MKWTIKILTLALFTPLSSLAQNSDGPVGARLFVIDQQYVDNSTGGAAQIEHVLRTAGNPDATITATTYRWQKDASNFRVSKQYGDWNFENWIKLSMRTQRSNSGIAHLDNLREHIGQFILSASTQVNRSNQPLKSNDRKRNAEIHIFLSDFFIGDTNKSALEYEFSDQCFNNYESSISKPEVNVKLIVYPENGKILPDSALRALASKLNIDPSGGNSKYVLLGQARADCAANIRPYFGGPLEKTGSCKVDQFQSHLASLPACPQPVETTSTAGNGTSSSGTAGNGTSSSGIAGNGTSSSGTAGNGTSSSSTAGNGTSSSSTAGNGTSSSSTAGNGTTSSSTAGNGTTSSSTAGNGTTSGGVTSSGFTAPPTYTLTEPQLRGYVNQIQSTHGTIALLPYSDAWNSQLMFYVDIANSSDPDLALYVVENKKPQFQSDIENLSRRFNGKRERLVRGMKSDGKRLNFYLKSRCKPSGKLKATIDYIGMQPGQPTPTPHTVVVNHNYVSCKRGEYVYTPIGFPLKR